MEKPVFRRKIYNEILEWKENRSDKYALLIKGARRVGKSTIAEEFAKKEFKSYIMIDFANTSKAIKDLFDDTYDLDFFFLQLQQLTGTRLFEKESVIIFDEVQLLPKARQAIKYLVADGRYKYIETGSLISIRKNTKDILIPSEEHKISMYPMDFEEFLWANGVKESSVADIREYFEKREPVPDAMHEKMMELFREYIVVGGMPRVVLEFVNTHNFAKVLRIQKGILSDYTDD
ncbi:MAG: AAA family ATPase, partial [Eubacterium sp.]|nr:AAA family ATPase [Eubacterium sp.]